MISKPDRSDTESPVLSTLPVAINVFVVKNITKEPFGTIDSGVYPFLISLVVVGALLFIFPQIATFLPSALMK